MSGFRQSHRDVWSLSLGRWRGVHVRLHIFFVLFGVFTGYLAWRERVDGDNSLMWLALLSMGMLFFSVLLHELGHYFVARKLGGHMDALVLGPLGGLRPARVPQDPQSELLAVLAGPATSLATCIVFLLISLVAGGDVEQSQLLHLLQPSFSNEPSIMFFQLLCWINWWLFITNLIPAFPFDGGRAFSSLIQVIKPDIDNYRATAMVATFARLVAIVFFVLAFVFVNATNNDYVPTWMAFLLLSVFVFFSARVEEAQIEDEEEEEELFGYDFSQGYTSLERSTAKPEPKPGPISRWLERMKTKRLEREMEIARSEEEEADRILQRLHEHGMDSISPAERALLQRVSARLRTKDE